MGFDLHHHGNPGPDPSCFYASAALPFYAGGNASDPHGSPIGIGADGYFMYAERTYHRFISYSRHGLGRI